MALWALVEAGDLTVPRFRALGASLIAQANQAGVQLADMGLTAEVTRQLRRPTAPLGLRPTPVQVDRDRIAGGIDRIIAEPDPKGALARLGRSEPLLTVAATVQTAMVRRGATGWTRQLDNDPCKVCSGWADGVVRSTGTRMARHVGCGCIQQPVFTDADKT